MITIFVNDRYTQFVYGIRNINLGIPCTGNDDKFISKIFVRVDTIIEQST